MLLAVILLGSCDNRLTEKWTAETFIDAYGEVNGVTLQIKGERLSSNVKEAKISFNNIEDLISGGYKDIFTILIDGKTSSNEITIYTPDEQEYVFPCYDGLIFNTDYESDDVERLIELMNFEWLKFTQDEKSFTISTSGFLTLYSEHFYQQQSML